MRSGNWKPWVLLGVLTLFGTRGAGAAEIACPITPARHLDLPVVQSLIAARQPITVVAFGSSSTEGAGASAPDRAYPARLEARLRRALPGLSVTVLNRGIGGQTVESMMDRIDTDVLPAHPALVIWQDGANEALRGMDPTRFAARLDAGIRRIAESGGDVVLMDNQTAPRILRADPEGAFIAAVADEARARRVSLFSRAALMGEWAAIDPSATDMIGPDGLHQTDRGYDCVAEALSRAILDSVALPVLRVGASQK